MTGISRRFVHLPLPAVLAIGGIVAVVGLAAHEPAPPRGGEAHHPRSFEIAAVGDILVHMPVAWRAAENARSQEDRLFDFRPMFAEVRAHFREADLSICHLEVPLTEDPSELSGFPRFYAPAEVADDLSWSGFDACSTASNHTLDQGMEGLRSTLDALEEAGLEGVGSHRTRAEARTPQLYEVGGVTVGHIAATYGLNGMKREHPWAVDLLRDDRFEERAEAAREAGAEFVVASFHWGDEYEVEPNREQRTLARRLLEGGTVDLILGHHAHVVQPVEEIAGRPVLYGLGNFLSNQSRECCGPGTQDGVVALVEVEEDLEDGGWNVEPRFVPTRVDRSDFTIVDVPEALAAGVEPSAEAQLRASRERAISVLGRDRVK